MVTPGAMPAKRAADSVASAYSSPSVKRSRMSLDLKKRFCLGSDSTCSQVLLISEVPGR